MKVYACKRKMVDNSGNEMRELVFSPLLFTICNQFTPISFVMSPCNQKRRVRQLIELGGGCMTRSDHNNDANDDNRIHLIDRNHNIGNNESICYYFCDYINDCCEANELLDINKYRCDVSANSSVRAEHCNIKRDMQLLTYIITRKSFADLYGNSLWTKAFEDGINFDDKWETTKSRFFDNIMPNIDKYLIDEHYKQQFKIYCHKTNNTNIESPENSDILNNDELSVCNSISIPNIVITPPSPALSQSDQTEINETNDRNQCYEQQINIIDVTKVTETHQNLNENRLLESDISLLTNDTQSKDMETNSIQSEEVETNVQSKAVEKNIIQSEEVETNNIQSKAVETNIHIQSEEVETSNIQSKDMETNSIHSKEVETINAQSKTFFSRDKQNNDAVKAYLDFVKQRKLETANENFKIKRIKDAMKVSKKCESANNEHQPVSSSKRTSKSNFGTKILENVGKASRKSKRTESFSSESGDQVSDICSDDSNTEQIEDSDGDTDSMLSVKYSKQNYRVSRFKMSFRHKSTAFYDLSEDEAIIKYVLQSSNLSELKGNTMWQKAEKKNICDRRSWQSMKERFRKHIMSNIESYSISTKEKSRLKKYFFVDKEDSAKSSNVSYSEEEDRKIIRYIVTKREYNSVTGNTLWQQMEKQCVINRTWQSMKERYKKRIIPNLDKYKLKLDYVERLLASTNWLTSAEQKELKNKCDKVLINAKETDLNVNSKLKKRSLPVHERKNNSDIDTDSETSQTQPTNKQSKRTKKALE